jgi:hypothetical protein
MLDQTKTTDKGKRLATTEQTSTDLLREVAQQKEKLELDARRRFLPGGMDRGESSGEQGDSSRRQEASRQQDTGRILIQFPDGSYAYGYPPLRDANDRYVRNPDGSMGYGQYAPKKGEDVKKGDDVKK